MIKPIKILGLTLGTTVLVSFPAYADQCAYVTREQALRAASYLNLQQTIYLFCEPCGEKIPESIQIKSISASTVDYEDFWQVYVNGKGLDLAYTFIESSLDRQPINLAAIAGCPAEDVSPFLPKT